MKKRADLLLIENKIVQSRNKAQAMIMAGQIYINGKKVLKSGELFDINSKIIYKSLHPQWVSRGALKLLHALEYFQVKVDDFTCLDIGASTGGFTEVLLSKKVKKVYCVDVGKNQLHEKIKTNAKIIDLSKTNARYLNDEIISEKINMIVCDVSFISMKKVIEPSLNFLDHNGIIIALIKPQFESEKSEIKKGGIISDVKIHRRICMYYHNWFTKYCEMEVSGIIPSPIKGLKGNNEFLIYAKKKL